VQQFELDDDTGEEQRRLLFPQLQRVGLQLIDLDNLVDRSSNGRGQARNSDAPAFGRHDLRRSRRANFRARVGASCHVQCSLHFGLPSSGFHYPLWRQRSERNR